MAGSVNLRSEAIDCASSLETRRGHLTMRYSDVQISPPQRPYGMVAHVDEHGQHVARRRQGLRRSRLPPGCARGRMLILVCACLLRSMHAVHAAGAFDGAVQVLVDSVPTFIHRVLVGSSGSSGNATNTTATTTNTTEADDPTPVEPAAEVLDNGERKSPLTWMVVLSILMGLVVLYWCCFEKETIMPDEFGGVEHLSLASRVESTTELRQFTKAPLIQGPALFNPRVNHPSVMEVHVSNTR
mmetsp:Transcript_24056/g.55349  ORF Transcript_24056/g.55349 Transcript_24056/m.55349 type:complete len:242 (-) Transcript_24056:478-1203(-)